MKKLTLLITALLALTTLESIANISLPRLVSNNMVLQRDVALPVWGWADAGENITVNFNGSNYNATTAANGKWQVILPATAGGNTAYTLTFTGNNVVTVTGVVFGDVFICSGQSNMAHIVSTSQSLYASEIASSTNNYIRHFKVKRAYSSTDLEDVESVNGWQSTTPATVLNFSAVAYFFARDLYTKYNMPIGLLNSSYEGTPAQAWMSQDALTAYPQYLNGTYVPNTVNPEYDPSVLYKAMINPLLTVKFKSILWYQGESNRLKSYEYRTLFPALINNWRTKFNNAAMPFLFVQLHNYGTVNSEPEEANTAECREAQAMALSLPYTGMATAFETSSDEDTHPLEKKPVGIRLSLAAQNVAYGDGSVMYQGPTFSGYSVAGNKIIISFTNIGGGLTANSALQRFAIAGADRKFKYATATIVGNTVEVYHSDIAKPVAVRYGWAFNPAGANLYSVSGLPAYPFRTDAWAGTSYIAPAVASTLANSFTAGNLVAYRFGTGTNPLSTVTVPVFIDEFVTEASAAPVQSLAIPPAADASGARFVALPKSATAFSVEGMPALSQDGQFLTLFGHDQSIGTGSTGLSVQRTVAIIDQAGNIDKKTKFSGTGGSPRAAVLNLNSLWSCGYTNTIYHNTKSSASTNENTAATVGVPARSLQVFKGKLYGSTGNNGFMNFPSANPLGTTGVTPITTTLAGTLANNQMAFLDLNGDNNPDVVYVADDGGNSGNAPYLAAIRKYRFELVTAPATYGWVAKGSIRVADTAIIHGLKGITARIVGTTAEVYANTWGSFSSASLDSTSVIIKLLDENIATSVLSKATTPVEVIARADKNTQFKGIMFTPGTAALTTLPIGRLSFSANKNAGKVDVKWSTSAEINNDKFEVTRSADGNNFIKIGSVIANGNSTVISYYSFTDAAPLAGTAYYRLKQINKDGAATYSSILKITDGKNANSIQVSAAASGNISLAVMFNKDEKTTVTIMDAAGKNIAKQNINIIKGMNSFSVPVYLAKGIYVAAIQTTEGLLTVKFLKD